MRGKKTFINTVMNLLEVFVSVVCGFILPRLILTAFGSKYNGLTTSITQFLACAEIINSGIGGVTRAALYKPLAQKNKSEIDSIIKATDIFMKKVGSIIAGVIIAFAAIYPFFVSYEFDWLFTFSLFIIIGINTFAKSFFGITYLTLVQADQRLWVSSLLRTICTILNIIVAAILIYAVDSIHIVKLGSALVYVIYPLALRLYVKKRYNINSNAQPDNTAIAHRWDALGHQIANFVVTNTDVMVLTVFKNMLEVSVYSVYSLIVNGLKKLVFSFSNGLEAAFGSMIANKEKEALKDNLSLVEWIMYNLSTVVYTCAVILVIPFVKIYTSGVTDVDYIRPVFSAIILIAQFFNCVRIPYQLVVQAAGHYKQTRNGAIFEAVINLGISILLVIKYGIVGVAIGTLAATVFRTIQYSYYVCKNIVNRSQWITLLRVIISFTEALATVVVVNALHLSQPKNYLDWFINALITLVVCCVIVVIGSILFDKSNIKRLRQKISVIFNKKKQTS